jgi:methylated-DNA-protein-cysteine methyltransferase-like protein
MNSFEKVYKVVSKIPKGKVSTYKEVSILADVNNPRIVGYALHSNKTPDTIPCHRVIKSNGKVAEGYAFGGKGVQIKMLKKEGVMFLDKDTIDLSKSLYSL